MPFLRVGAPATMDDVIAHIEHVAQDRGRGPCRDRHRQWRAADRREAMKQGAGRLFEGADQAGHRRAGRGGRRLSVGRAAQQRRPLPPGRRSAGQARLEPVAAGEADGRQFPARLQGRVGRLTLSRQCSDVVADDRADPRDTCRLPIPHRICRTRKLRLDRRTRRGEMATRSFELAVDPRNQTSDPQLRTEMEGRRDRRCRRLSSVKVARLAARS